MHKTKVGYLRHLFPEKDCLSAITTVDIDHMIVGTPVMVDIKPFVPKPNPSRPGDVQFIQHGAPPMSYSGSRHTVPHVRDGGYAKAGIITEKVPAPKRMPAAKKTSAEDLYKMGVVKANEILQSSVKVNAMFVFSSYKDYHDFHIRNMGGHQIYFDGRKPLIFDEGHRFELERLADVHKKGDLNNFSEMIYDSLKENRYINYSFGGVSASNKRYMLEDINTIFNDIQRMFPKNFSFFSSLLNNGVLRSLVDTVSISFYRMQDVIAIFDSKRMSGLGAEIFLTNSNHTPAYMNESEATATYRFLFSKSRENVLTIDGELIRRQHDRSTNDALGAAFSVINKNIPIDNESKRGKEKTISAEWSRRSICVE